MLADIFSEEYKKLFFSKSGESLLALLREASSKESWTLDDDPSILEALKQLGKKAGAEFSIDGQEERILFVTSLLSLENMMVLIKYVYPVEQNEEMKSVISTAIEIQQQPEHALYSYASVFLERVVFISKSNLADLIFNPERLNSIIQSLEGFEKNAENNVEK